MDQSPLRTRESVTLTSANPCALVLHSVGLEITNAGSKSGAIIRSSQHFNADGNGTLLGRNRPPAAH